ncbi:hypothetical protein ACA910_022026 [Epithemia clementina (nom. ined.)]
MLALSTWNGVYFLAVDKHLHLDGLHFDVPPSQLHHLHQDHDDELQQREKPHPNGWMALPLGDIVPDAAAGGTPLFVETPSSPWNFVKQWAEQDLRIALTTTNTTTWVPAIPVAVVEWDNNRKLDSTNNTAIEITSTFSSKTNFIEIGNDEPPSTSLLTLLVSILFSFLIVCCLNNLYDRLINSSWMKRLLEQKHMYHGLPPSRRTTKKATTQSPPTAIEDVKTLFVSAPVIVMERNVNQTLSSKYPQPQQQKLTELADWFLACFREQQKEQQLLQQQAIETGKPATVNVHGKQSEKSRCTTCTKFLGVLEVQSKMQQRQQGDSFRSWQRWQQQFLQVVPHRRRYFHRRLFVIGDDKIARSILEDTTPAVAPWNPVFWTPLGACLSPHQQQQTNAHHERWKPFRMSIYNYNSHRMRFKNNYENGSSTFSSPAIEAILQAFIKETLEPSILPNNPVSGMNYNNRNQNLNLLECIQVLATQVFLHLAFDDPNVTVAGNIYTTLLSKVNCQQLLVNLRICYNEFQKEVAAANETGLLLLRPTDYTNWIMHAVVQLQDKETAEETRGTADRGRKQTAIQFVHSFCWRLLQAHSLPQHNEYMCPSRAPYENKEGGRSSRSNGHCSCHDGPAIKRFLEWMDDNVNYENDTQQQLQDLVAFLIHGIPPIIHTMTFCLLELAQHPYTHQENLRIVLQQGQGAEKVNQSKSNQLPTPPLTKTSGKTEEESIVQNIIREVLRLHAPNALGSIRILLKDVTLTEENSGCAGLRSCFIHSSTDKNNNQDVMKNTDKSTNSVTRCACVIPGGSVVLLPSTVLHRNGHIYDAPDRFRPQRWDLATDDMFWAYMPFSAGPQGRCPVVGGGGGQHPWLVHATLQITLCRLFARHEFRVVRSKTGDKKANAFATTVEKDVVSFWESPPTGFVFSVQLANNNVSC